MRSTLSLVALVAPVMVSGFPTRHIPKRSMSEQMSSSSGQAKNSNNALVLKFANVLEQAEATFYQQALGKFQASDITGAGFPSADFVVEQLKNIQSDEATHSAAIESALKALGEEPIQGCQFNFDAALADLPTTLATARVVENLGVTAYLGGATLIDDPVILDAAGSILTIEARHSTLLNVLSGTGTAIPAAFDIPFTPSEVLALAGPLISGCDTGIPANTPLTITNTGTPAPGTKLEFKASSINGSTEGLSCQMMTGGTPIAISLPFDNCVVPDGLNGPVAIFITNDQTPLVNNVRDRNAAQIVAGPQIAFIDTKPEQLGAMVRKVDGAAPPSGESNSSSNGETVSTTTITPEEASSIINAASATDSASVAGATGGAESNNAATGPVLTTGAAGNGMINVNGWTFAPGQGDASASGSAPTPSASA